MRRSRNYAHRTDPMNTFFRTAAFADAARNLDKVQGIRTQRRFKAGAPMGASFTAADDDAAIRAIMATALPMDQLTQTYAYPAGNNTAQGQQVSIALNNVGLQTSIILEVEGTFTQSAAEIQTKTAFGLSNIFSNIRVTDFSGVERVNTTSRHLHALASLRRGGLYGAAYTTDSPPAWGSNFPVNKQPSPVTAGQAFRWFIEIPLAYNPKAGDFRGALYAAVTSAQWRIQWTLNNTFAVGSGATDVLNACYKSSTAGDLGLLSGVTVKIYQVYFDQLPGKIPLISLSYNYLLTTTTQTGMLANADFGVMYPNYRMFLSTIAVYDNAGAFNLGTDVAYLAIQVANLLYPRKYDPFRATLETRNIIGDDPPAGMYIFDHRQKPIISQVYGNTQFILNATAVTAGASLELAFESMAVQAQASNAGSFPSG